jgi:trehalose 6-phosphate synthase/phosphatase
VPRLILVSNRLPVTFTPTPAGLSVRKSVGGLATALRDPHERSNGLWVGWPGPTDELRPEELPELDRRLAEIGAVPVHLTGGEVTGYYGSFSNGILWPLFHYLTGVAPLRVEGWDEYREANAKFANLVAEHYRKGDLIWVHDYQLMLVPRLLRERLPGARIGFFLHIPFPSSELFATLPHRRELLEGLLGADLIGFHIDGYRRHFRSAVDRILELHTEETAVLQPDRRVRLGVFPIGVDAKAIAARAEEPAVIEAAAKLRQQGPDRLLLGIDRLDYTKGIPRRLLAYEELLSRWPEWQGAVRLIQVAVPSRGGVRAYRDFRQEIDTLVGRINGEFGTPFWVPIHYIHRVLDDIELSALYRTADVMLVTPVRDGMNLVAKEFVASRVDEDGVLVLSEFAGAAAQLQGAVQVNPFDLERTAKSYHLALSMSRAERRERMHTLRQSVFTSDVYQWIDSFLCALGLDN